MEQYFYSGSRFRNGGEESPALSQKTRKNGAPAVSAPKGLVSIGEVISVWYRTRKGALRHAAFDLQSGKCDPEEHPRTTAKLLPVATNRLPEDHSARPTVLQ